ncbi:MAG: ABC transporter ATP-binding protein [Aigarchaeota archaeon]|nr:ABC transporter ATP-binding protein [Aigarchaeota archaeon]MDW8092745.1 ABC transporter ATP-binding protein [Nitrososphaerota archaeon]
MNEIIVVDKLTKKYGDFLAVNNVSFIVKQGEVFSLLGPNGAGKTTIVEILECLRTPTSGVALIKGMNVKDPSEVKRIKRLIGVLPQEFNAIDNLTVYENVELAASAKGSRNVKDILEALGLWEMRKSAFSKLSGGLKRRVGIAMALVGDPEIVFLDEPTTGLDPEARRETWSYIRKLKKSGVTIFLTTHYMEEAERLSDRVAIIVRGRIAAEGDVRRLVSEQGGKTRLIFEDLGERAAEALRGKGYEVEPITDDRTVVKVSDKSEVFEVLSILRGLSIDAYPEIHHPGLEDVFLRIVGSKISERGELI